MSDERKATVARADIVEGLRKLGLQEGDVVLTHTSLSSFGYVEGGAEAVVDALLEAVGPTGTVCAPTATWAGCAGGLEAAIYPGGHNLTPGMLDDLGQWFKEVL